MPNSKKIMIMSQQMMKFHAVNSKNHDNNFIKFHAKLKNKSKFYKNLFPLENVKFCFMLLGKVIFKIFASKCIFHVVFQHF